MRELFKPLSDIKIAGRYVFKEIAENIDEIERWKEGTFEADYEYEIEELKKDIERIRRENERQNNDTARLIKKKYDLIEVEEEEKTKVGKEEAERFIERYCDEESEREEKREEGDDYCTNNNRIKTSSI